MRRIVLTAVLAALGLGLGTRSVRADTVKMKSGLIFFDCKVIEEADDYIVILVYKNAGKVKLERSKIAAIDYDLASKLAELEPEDWKGHYYLAVWAMSKGMYKDAALLFDLVRGKDGAGDDTVKQLGLAYDKLGQIDKALAVYRDWIKSHPEDAAIAARIEEIRKQLGLDDPKPADGPKKAQEGLEGDANLNFRWAQVKGWPNVNECTVRPYTEPDSNDKMVLVSLPGGDKDKAVFEGKGLPLNLTDRTTLSFRIYQNSSKPLKITVAFQNKDNEYFEGKSEKVAPNEWVQVEIPLGGTDFKTEKSKWAFTDTLRGKEHINNVLFLIYAQNKVDLYVDRIFFK